MVVIKNFVIFLIMGGFLGSCGNKESPKFPSETDIVKSEVRNFSSQVKGPLKDTLNTIVVGSIAPDFKLKSLSGSDLTLSSIKEKYIILDFWGSWCVPCLKDFPKMKEYYKKYSDQIEIVGIAYLDTENSWKQSVKKHELNWLQVIDNGKDQDVTVNYGVKSFPTKFILNQDRKVLGRYGSSEEFYQKIDELLQTKP